MAIRLNDVALSKQVYTDMAVVDIIPCTLYKRCYKFDSLRSHEAVANAKSTKDTTQGFIVWERAELIIENRK